MIFAPGQAVLWGGEPCTVVAVRERIALARDSDGYTIITDAETLAAHQPAPLVPPTRSLIGGP